jgi:signal transduction histidine kinase
LRAAAAAGVAVILIFLVCEGLEQGLDLTDAAAHRLHYFRGLASSLAAATTAAFAVYQDQRRRTRAMSDEIAFRTREAQEARTFLQVIVDNVPEALLVVDRDRRIVEANRTARRVHGMEAVGQRCHELLSGMGAPCPGCRAWEGAAQKELLPCPHNEPRTGEALAIESYPLTSPDGRDFILLIERVVTEQRKLEARVLHQEKMAAFGLLAAGVAHEMGNPLASIEVQLQLLDLDPLPGAAGDVVRVVRQEVARLRRTLREMVDFARRRRDEAGLVSVQSVAEDALRLLAHDSRMRRIRVVGDYDPETPPVFLVEDHMMQVVLNLLLNAVDAMPEGGALRVELKAVGAQTVLRVHDTGTGMDRTVLGHCFEPLFTTKAPGKGTGLGLSITRDIVRAAGGEIELHSVPGRGTTAVVTLPAAASETAALAAGPRTMGA